jgi:hypothetical protein
MIYFTTFIFTLLLAHITRAVPGCGDAASPEGLYDPTYDDVQEPLFAEHKVTWDPKYGHKHGDTKTVECRRLAHRYPQFKDFPDFPYIGAAHNIKEHDSPNCGKCWKLHNKKTHKSIHFTAIDSTSEKGFKVSKQAFEKLNDGKPGTSLDVEATQVPPSVCGFK